MRHLMIIIAASAVAAATAVAAPVEVRLTPDAAAAAIESGSEANRAADALALARGDPRLSLPGERDGGRADRKIHGEVGAGFGTGGAREVFGEFNAPLGDTGSAAFAYDYNQFGRQRARGPYPAAPYQAAPY